MSVGMYRFRSMEEHCVRLGVLYILVFSIVIVASD